MYKNIWRRWLACSIGLMCFLSNAHAATLWKEDVERMLGEAYIVGEMQPDLPAWPLFAANPAQPDAKPELKAYGFESNDFATVRGYSGKPINMFVLLDLRGRFIDIKLLDHREPIFLRPEGTAKLQAYAAQHKGLTLRHNIQLGRPSDTPSHNSQFAYLAGVQTGTISAKAISRTLMTAAANVAVAAKLAVPLENPATPIGDSEPVTEAAAPKLPPKETKAEPAAAAAREEPTEPGKPAKTAAPDAASAVVAAPANNASATPGAAAATTATATADTEAATATAADAASATTATTAPTAQIMPMLEMAAPGEPDWLPQWRERRTEIVIVLIALALLSVALIAQCRFSANPRRLRVFRTLYLLFTLGFIGWTAQGQLTIVNVTAALESLAVGDDLSFLMNDPISVILWVFTGVTLLVWGRGVFCGWLCPFGALQELVSLLANAVGVRQRRLRVALDAKLKWIKYGVLAVIIGSVFLAPGFAGWAVEIEPFKTAISLYFDRAWPYVLWASACITLSVFVYRGYCRYICPLGAALASVSILRRWNWLPRRAECGTPCQTCRHRCEYQAIEPSGRVNYRECFQCLDCVAIYQDDKHCLPLIQRKKQQHKMIEIQLVRESA